MLSSSVFDRQGSWVEDEDRSIDTAQRLYKLNPSGNEPIAVLFVRELRQAVAILRDCVELPPQTESGADRVSLYQGVAAGGTKQSPEFAESDLNGWDLPLAHSLSQGVAAISFPELYIGSAPILGVQGAPTKAANVANLSEWDIVITSRDARVSVKVNQKAATLLPSQSHQFFATVTGTRNTAVTWSLDPAIGSISPHGIYTAPAMISSKQVVMVVATSVANPKKSAAASVTLTPPVNVTITPGSLALTSSESHAFAASVSGTSNTAVTWSLSPGVGTVSSAGFYTAPSSIPTSQIVKLTATSVASPAESASVSISLTPSVSVTLTPVSIELTPSHTQIFAASVLGASNQAVTWSLSPSVGSISSSGVYTAPGSITSSQTITITATSVSDPSQSARALVSLMPPITVAIAPSNVTLSPSQSAAFAASVSGTADTTVTWSVSPAVGMISPAGVYTAPATITTPQTITVTATSAENPLKSANANISLSVPVTAAVTPTEITLIPSQSLAFHASITGTSNTAVTWSVSPAVGSISSTGIYTAPTTFTSSQTITVTATSVASPSTAASATISLPTFRDAAGEHGLLVSAAADADDFGYPDPLVLEPLYAETLGTQYSMVQPENAMKWISIHPEQGTYYFEPADQIVAFGQAHNMKIRGHNLVWNASNPDWLNTLASTATPGVMSETLQSHIQTVMNHYKGQVLAWDVVNEAIDDNATGIGTQMADSIWYNQPGIGLTGTGYVEQAFRWAHAVDPDALLFYNDNIVTPGPKFEALMNMLTDFVSRGVPINGVGLEMHVTPEDAPATASLAQLIQQITALGLQVHITEMDVAIPVNSAGVASASDLQAEAQTYQNVLSACLQYPGCTGFQTWGFSDKHSWVPIYMPGLGAALPFDLNYQPKPAFTSMMDVLVNMPAN